MIYAIFIQNQVLFCQQPHYTLIKKLNNSELTGYPHPNNRSF